MMLKEIPTFTATVPNRQLKPVNSSNLPQLTILVVDDEEDILDLIRYNLEKEGYRVVLAENGEEGLHQAEKHRPDLILLDIMMPKVDGLEMCRKVRAHPQLGKTPVIFLTARGDEKTEVEGLERGADDYIVKPISTKKLISRIRAVMRRFEITDKEEPRIIEIDDLVIDKDRYLVRKGEKELHLPRKEFELLYYLAGKRGKVLSREILLNEVWGDDVFVVDRTIDVHIRKIREKLGENLIETVKGVGYRFRE